MKKIFFIIFILCLMISCSMAESQEKTGTIKIYRFDEHTYPDMAKITFDHALSVALKECPGRLLELELEAHEDYLVYQVEIVTSDYNIMEICVDAGNGSILMVTPEKDSDTDEYEDNYSENPVKPGTIKLEKRDEARYPDMAKISFKDAIDMALAKEPGKLISIELEDMDEYLVYEIKLVTSEKKLKQIILDPVTGDILKSSTERTEKDFNEDTVF
ncbi:MAG: PepSY domain-containing protein [Candidatus Eremiobacterota bacterium]